MTRWLYEKQINDLLEQYKVSSPLKKWRIWKILKDMGVVFKETKRGVVWKNIK